MPRPPTRPQWLYLYSLAYNPHAGEGIPAWTRAVTVDACVNSGWVHLDPRVGRGNSRRHTITAPGRAAIVTGSRLYGSADGPPELEPVRATNLTHAQRANMDTVIDRLRHAGKARTRAERNRYLDGREEVGATPDEIEEHVHKLQAADCDLQTAAIAYVAELARSTGRAGDWATLADLVATLKPLASTLG